MNARNCASCPAAASAAGCDRGRPGPTLEVNPLEIAATAFTLVCVVLAVQRSLWQFPFGVVGTGLSFFMFLGGSLYSSAALQVFFLAVQFYGWWYWMKGHRGGRPPIRTTRPRLVAGLCAGAFILAVPLGLAFDTWTDAQNPMLDAGIFTLSVVAQFLLDRKRIENWPIWAVINVVSVYVYASQELWIYAGLYVFFFFNAFWGWWEWRNELRGYTVEKGAA